MSNGSRFIYVTVSVHNLGTSYWSRRKRLQRIRINGKIKSLTRIRFSRFSILFSNRVRYRPRARTANCPNLTFFFDSQSPGEYIAVLDELWIAFFRDNNFSKFRPKPRSGLPEGLVKKTVSLFLTPKRGSWFALLIRHNLFDRDEKFKYFRATTCSVSIQTLQKKSG